MEIKSSLLFWLLISLALGLAWFSGYRSRFTKFAGLKRSPDLDYFIGLNYLLNDEPDDAIDVFIDALELNSDTLDTHLALATLLRRRGKVDRAIEHCQQLLDSQRFSARELHEVQINLVRSYISAGLLDRAEKLLEDLKQSAHPVREAALGLAITVYQMERDWVQAIAAATELLKICPVSRKAELQLQASHFYCEMAENAVEQGNMRGVRDCLRKAAELSPGNVRVQLLLGNVAAGNGHYEEAVAAFRQVLHSYPDYAGEVGNSLLESLQKAGMDEHIAAVIAEAREGHLGSAQLLEVAEYLRTRQDDVAVMELLLIQLAKDPSLLVLAQTLDAAARQGPDHRHLLETGAGILHTHLQSVANYRCENCGFELKNLHWLCPGCSKWGMVVPLAEKAG